MSVCYIDPKGALPEQLSTWFAPLLPFSQLLSFLMAGTHIYFTL